MNRSKLLKTAALLTALAMTLLLSGCISAMMLNTARKQQETYCYVSLSPPAYKTLNGGLYDLSHAYGIGLYIVDDFAPGAADGAGRVVFSAEADYAAQVYAAHDELAPYKNFVLLAIGNNVLQFGEGGAAAVDMLTGGLMKAVLAEEVCTEMTAKVTAALEQAGVAGEDEWDRENITNEEYQTILYAYLEELTPYLESAAAALRTVKGGGAE